MENRKKFFEGYAKENGFDPYVAENWYTQTSGRIRSVKVRYGAREGNCGDVI